MSIKTSDGSGTGFIVDANGTIVTNAHVVGTESTVQVQFADDETVTGRVGGVDRSSDLAVVKITTSRTLKPLALADSSAVKTGQLAVAIGSPFGLSQTTTAGIVSGTGRHIQAPDGFQIDSVIQTDAPINPGNSGGPLLDATGRVIGVNSQIASQSGGSVGIGFAVPSNTVRDVIPRLERGETIKRAYLGVSTSARLRASVTVAAVTAGGPAANAGLQVGDVITSVGGKKVASPDDVAAAIQDRQPGESVQVEVDARRVLADADVTLAERPANGDAMTFQSPWLLLGLRAAAVAGVGVRRRRRSAGGAPRRRSPRPPMSASVVPRRPGWRRHAPLALAWLAVAALIGALARPQVSVAVPAEQATIVLDDGPLRLDGGDRRRSLAPDRRAGRRRGVPGARCPSACGSAASSSTTSPRPSSRRPPTAPRCARRSRTR